MQRLLGHVPIAARAFSVLAAMLLALAAGAFADEHHDAHEHRDVHGIVTARDGAPIVHASITLTGGGQTIRAVSDHKGKFELKDVRPGTYVIAAVAPGFSPISARTLDIAEPHETRVTLVMDPATNDSLTVIGQVSASSGEDISTSSGTSTSLNAQTAAAAGTTTVGDMVWNELSVTPVLPLGGGSNATTTFSLRDPDPTETLVEIDGHPVNNGTTGDFDLSLVDPAALQDVQLVYGISPASLLGPNTIGGAINILTLQPTSDPHALLRVFGGSYGSFGETVQATGSDGLWGYALSLHGASSDGSVNRTIVAPAPGSGSSSSSDAESASGQFPQSVGSTSSGETALAKLRYRLGGPNGYGYIQFDYRDQVETKDESALLTNYTPAGFNGGGGDDFVSHDPLASSDAPSSGVYQSFAGTTLAAHQANYGFDAQVPLGGELLNGAPATLLQFSHLTTLASQSVSGPGAQTLPYLYNQRDVLGDDWLQVDHHFSAGTLSFKYDLGTEALDTNYVQGQITAEIERFDPLSMQVADVAAPPVETIPISQTKRSAVLRWDGEASSRIHYAVAEYYSDFSTFGTSFDPRAGIVWTPDGNTALRATVGTTFQIPQLTELVVVPAADLVPIGGVVYNGNANLQPDRATEYTVGAERIIGSGGHALHLSADFYLTSLRGPSNQLNVEPKPGCKPSKCPVSYPVNAGNGYYRGVDLSADQQIGSAFHVRAGWSVDSSYLTTIPASIQDGTLVSYEQSLGQPLQKGYVSIDRDVPKGLVYGARLSYEGLYNELNRSPYATLDAHVAYRDHGYEFGLYGTNLTNVYAAPFTVEGGGITYGAQPGNPVIPTPAYVLQGTKVVFVVTDRI